LEDSGIVTKGTILDSRSEYSRRITNYYIRYQFTVGNQSYTRFR